jgi:tripartite-type tricarboxylate transporter receptor subunit TctC
MVTRYMAKHIPGQPNMVASNMPGAGSFTASNWLYRIAPKDGTALGTVSQTLAIDEALKSKGVQFKAAEFNWIGRVTSNVEVQVVSTRTEGATLAGAKKVVVPTASTGPGSPSDTYPKLMNEVAGTQFKIIRGFPGSTDGLLAVERGETDASLTSWNTMKTTRMNWLTDKKAVLFVQYVTKRSPDLKDVPTLVELASNDADRKLLSFAVSSAEIGRSILGPPGMPADRVAVLRKAFDAAMKDPELLAEVQKSNLDFEPLDGASLAKIVAEAANADPSVVARMQKIMEE